MNGQISAILVATATLLATGEALATGCPWTDHASPYRFVFGNDIDTHQ